MLELYMALRKAKADGTGGHEPVLAFCNLFIDDFPMLGLQGVGRAILVTFASLLHSFGIAPQGKKILPEGGFATF